MPSRAAATGSVGKDGSGSAGGACRAGFARSSGGETTCGEDGGATCGQVGGLGDLAGGLQDERRRDEPVEDTAVVRPASLQLEYLGGTPSRLGHVAGEHPEPGQPDGVLPWALGSALSLAISNSPSSSARPVPGGRRALGTGRRSRLQAHRPSHACS